MDRDDVTDKARKCGCCEIKQQEYGRETGRQIGKWFGGRKGWVM